MLRCGRARAVASVSRTLRQFAVMHMATVTEERADVHADQTSGPIGFRSAALTAGWALAHLTPKYAIDRAHARARRITRAEHPKTKTAHIAH